MKPSAKRAFSLLTTIALLLAAFLLYASLLRPSYEEVKQLRGVSGSKSEFFQEQSQALSKVNDLIVQYRGTGRLQDTISLSIPLDEDLSSIFNQLRALSAINGLSIDIFGVKPQAFRPLSDTPLVKDVGVLQLSVKLSGTYEAFRGFLRGLETNIRVMDVQQFRVSRVASTNTNFFNYDLVVDTYYQSNQ